ncbi:MAG: hypothetical protein IPJ81_16555 [Chitinophagaceae bacterium]|nr:hypothetical protein [Chitinophagaceae bacterium]
MRIIILLIVIGAASCVTLKKSIQQPSSKITLYVFNDETSRPGQTLEEEFWKTTNGLDTIEIKGERLVNLYLRELASLKDTLLYEPGEINEFPHEYAFVFMKDNIMDTIYSNRLLYLFREKNKNKYYVDTTGFFRKHFDAFLIN